jgi:hypothetical protein
MSASVTNAAALASPIYNPNIDSTSLQLFNAMNTGYPAALVSQYTQMITSLPTANGYSTLLQNPQACNISQAQTGMSTLQSQITQQYNSTVLSGTPVGTISGTTYTAPAASGANPVGTAGSPGYSPSTTQVATLNTWQQAYPACMGNIAQANSTLSGFEDHTNRLIANFPSILGMIQTALGIATAIANLTNPCLGLANFLGSLLAKGAAIMAQINAAIDLALTVIGEVIAEINAAIQAVMALINSLEALIEAEILAFVEALIDAARLGLAQLLALLPLDPCLASILTTVGTGALTGTLKNL